MNNSVQTNNHWRGVRDQVVSPLSLPPPAGLMTPFPPLCSTWGLEEIQPMADTGVYMFTIKTLSSWKVEGGRWKVEGGSPLQTVGQAVAAG